MCVSEDLFIRKFSRKGLVWNGPVPKHAFRMNRETGRALAYSYGNVRVNSHNRPQS